MAYRPSLAKKSDWINENHPEAKTTKMKKRFSKWQVLHISFTLVLLATCFYQWNHKSSLQTNQKDTVDIESLHTRIERKNLELESTRKALRHAIKSRSTPEANQVENADELMHNLKKRDSAISKMLTRTTDAISLLSKQVLDIKYGLGVDFVNASMLVKFPTSMGLPSTGTITIEIAKTFMPVASLYFLSQVESGAWNGCSFIRNAHHVLQADPSSPGKEYLHSRFKAIPYQKQGIPFQEYNEEYPHVKYTLGLAGRPVSILDEFTF